MLIDEAYSLATDSAHDYGGEAVATLLKFMEDQHSDAAFFSEAPTMVGVGHPGMLMGEMGT